LATDHAGEHDHAAGEEHQWRVQRARNHRLCGQPLVGRQLDDPDRAENRDDETEKHAVERILCVLGTKEGGEIATSEGDTDAEDERDEPVPLGEMHAVDVHVAAVSRRNRGGPDGCNDRYREHENATTEASNR